MDRRSVIVAGTLSALLVAAIGVGIALSTGGGGGKAVVTPPGSSSTAPPTPTFPRSTTAPPVAPQTVPTLPKPTVVIQVPPSTSPASTTTPTTTPAGGETGITAHEIRISVIADDAAVAHGVQAWALATDQAGGLAGRQVRVDVRLVTSAASYAAAVSAACLSSYAVVGSSSQFDSQAGGLGCGIPELATRLFDASHRGLPNAYTVLPATAGVEGVGAFKRILATTSGCCRQYVLVPTTDPGRSATQQSVQAALSIGFTTAGTPDVAPGADYPAIVADLVAKGATFARSGLGADSTVQLRQAGAANPGAASVQAWYCDSRCDDPSFLATGGTAVNGQLVDDAANSLLDQHRVPAIAAYVRAVRHVGGVPTQAGVESYAAGMLFERAVRQVVATSGANGLTRARLLAAVAAIHNFNAGGILGTTDVGARQPTGCFQLLKVVNGHFVRSFPTAPATLDCGPQNLQTVP